MFLAEKQQAYDEYEVRFKVHSTRNTFNIIFKRLRKKNFKKNYFIMFKTN